MSPRSKKPQRPHALRLIALLWMMLLLAMPRDAVADGKFFATAADTNIPDQFALIRHDGAMQTLVIDTNFTGKGTEFAWVVPTPSEPTVKPCSRGGLQMMRNSLLPRVDSRSLREAGAWPFMIGFSIIIGLLAHLVLKMCRVGSTASAVSGTIVGVFFAIGLTLPTLSQRRGGSDDSSVTVLAATTVGNYEVNVLRAADGGSLIEWLASRAFPVDAASKGMIDAYIKDGWCFTACRLRTEEASGKTLSPHPLEFTFAAKTPVYPMRLTSVGSTSLALDIIVIGSKRAKANGMIHVGSESISSAASYVGAIRLPARSHPDIARIEPNEAVATLLRGRFTPEQMRTDITIEWTDEVPARSTAYPQDHVDTLAYGAGIGVFLGIAYVGIRMWRKRRTIRSFAVMTAATLGSAGAVYAGVRIVFPSVVVERGHKAFHDSWSIGNSAQEIVESESFRPFRGASKQEQLLALQKLLTMKLNEANSTSDAIVIEGDDVGQYRLFIDDFDSLALRWYGARMIVENRLFPPKP